MFSELIFMRYLQCEARECYQEVSKICSVLFEEKYPKMANIDHVSAADVE
jgi:hypothetical protein